MKNKKVALIDCDGILLNFNKYILSCFANAFDIKIPSNFIPKTWNMTDVVPKNKESVTWQEVAAPDWPAHLKPFTGAAQFIKNLKKLDYRIVLVTRIGQKHQVLRLNNLIDYEIEFDEIYFTAYGQSKADIVAATLKRHTPDEWIFIDDRASTCQEVFENINAYKDQERRIYTIDFPFNESVKKENLGLIWVDSEQELYKRVIKDAQNN